MASPSRAFVAPVLSLVLAACPGGGGGSTGSTGETSSGSASSGSTGAGTTGPLTATGEVSTGGGETTGTSTGAPTTGDASSGGGDSSGTGGAAWCYGYEESEPPAWLELYNKTMEPLTSGATLPLECGGQGIFMFGIYPQFGGFAPTDTDILDFDLVVDVEGYNTNPDGHFYNVSPIGYYVSCEMIIGGVVGVLPVFPLDSVPNVTDLDGKPATVKVVMHAPDGDVTVETDVVLSAVKDDTWTFCGG